MWAAFLRSSITLNGITSAKSIVSYRTGFRTFRTVLTSPKHVNILKRTNLFLISSRTNFFSRARSSRTELRRLLQLARPERSRITSAVVLLIISSSVTMAIPFCLGKVIDMLQLPPEEMKAKLWTFCQFLVLIFCIGALANFGRVYLINLSSYSITNRLRNETYKSILNQEIAFFDKTKTGELVNRMSSDASVVGLSLANNISDGLRSAFSLLAGTSLMIYTSPHLAYLGLLTVSPVAFIAVFYGKYLKKVTRSVQDSLASATEVAEEKISNIRTVHAFAQQEAEKRLFEEKIDKILHFAKKESLGRGIFFGLSGFSGNLIALTVLYSGGLMVTDNLITIGSLSSFLMYAAYVGISIGGLSTCYAELMRGLGASTRIWELISREPLICLNDPTSNDIYNYIYFNCIYFNPWITGPRYVAPDGLPLPMAAPVKGEVKFSNVGFSYPSRPDIQVLSSFNLSIPIGAVYAIVGPSGSGKSTLASLLLRFYDVTHGSVEIDGCDLRYWSLTWLRSCIGLVSQEPILFSSTIRENVCYGVKEEKDTTDTNVERVLKEANAWDFVSKFPRGLETIVGERGVMLSGGQRQRIAIARALIKDPKILVLDEATSALDAQSERLVQSALEKLMEGRTVLMIAHRLSTIRKANKIAVLDQGQIVEEGAYEDLLNKRGLFYRLVRHQTEDHQEFQNK